MDDEKYPYSSPGYSAPLEGGHQQPVSDDVFGNEENNAVRTKQPIERRWKLTASQIKYKTLSWQLVAVLMIAEIVSNGMLSLPSSLAVVGIVPGVIIIVFLGIFGTFTSWILIQFKLRHPEGSWNPVLRSMYHVVLTDSPSPQHG